MNWTRFCDGRNLISMLPRNAGWNFAEASLGFPPLVARLRAFRLRREPDFGAQAHLDWKPIFWQREPRANVPPDDILTAGAIRCEEVTSKLEMLADAPSQLEGDVRLPFVVAE